MKELVLIGSGNMAIAYCEALKFLNIDFTVIGNSEEKAIEFTTKTGKTCIPGGIQKYLENNSTKPSHAILAVQVEVLFDVSKVLINHGIEKILVEKPGGINYTEINELENIAKGEVELFVAYNRRFYQSVLQAKEEIEKDGGALSARFEFTEWSHVIEKLKKSDELKKNWFLANSTHVIDLAFSLIGKPKEISCYTSGKLKWHKPSMFCGSGISENNCLFSYYANWESSGRWGIEVNTSKRKLILSPLEILQEQQVGSIEIQKVEMDYSKDEKFKPGILEQCRAFINGEKHHLKSIQEQKNDLKFLSKINGRTQ